MKRISTILFLFVITFSFLETAFGQIRINEVRADASGTSGDEEEFVELIGISGTDISGYQIVHYNGSTSVDGGLWTHTIGSFNIPNEGISDDNLNNLGFFVLGVNGFSTDTDETTTDNFQNGPDGIVLYDDKGNILDAVAWEGEGDLTGDDPGTVTTSGSPEADHYLHVTIDDDSGDNSLQAPNNVIGDDGSGWTLAAATIGSLNSGQSSGSIIINSSVKAEPANHVTTFSATGSINSVDLSWTDAAGSPKPDAYLIKASDSGFGSITDPADTNSEPDDADLSDGSGILNVSYGVESASFSGLNETTTYYFKIYSYTNTGSDIDYKTDGTIPQDDATTLDTPDIVLNEILSDPDEDANGDGNFSTDDDEFLEFVNTGNSDLDITNWTVEDATSTTHTFENPTVLKSHQAIVVFGGGTPTGDFGGALVQTTSSLSLNNSGDDVILKNDSGVEIINIHYSGASNQSETRSPDITGTFTDHTIVDTDNGSSFSPGTRIGGFPFHPWIKISGNEGWRMLSTPTSNNSFDDLLNPLWTQGSTTGANYSGGDPNVVTYDGSSSFVPVDNLNSTMTPGMGFLIFVYSDDDHTNSGSDTGFPKILEMSGTENTGTISPTINVGTSNAATLVGNPYLSPIDWDLLDKGNLSNTVYVYDDNYGSPSSPDEEASGVAGSYRVWNGSSGSLDQGRIAPFQGFWVIYDGSGSASLTIEESDKTIGGTFYKDHIRQTVTFHLKAETNRMFNETFFSFNEGGRIGMDNFDGLELTPLDHGDYMSLATEINGTLLDINNLPLKFSEPIRIPLHINAYKATNERWTLMSTETTLTWSSLQNIPSNWSITLFDKKFDKKINLKETNSYKFLLEADAEKIVGKKPFTPIAPHSLQREKSPGNSRFFLSINPNIDGINRQTDIPSEFMLAQNYPNPFNPTTNIRYEIAHSSEVELSVYNLMGQRITTLVNETKLPGLYEVTWDASEMASGIYYYQLKAGGLLLNRQMTLIK